MLFNNFNKNILAKAFNNNEFSLYYQPIVNSSFDVMWVEALMRWNNPSIGMISPEIFIPLMEKNRLIIKAGTWVIIEACSQIKSWHQNNNVDFGISVNVSALQLQQYNFREIVYNALIYTNLKPENLLLEITESMNLGYETHVINTLKDLRSLGVRISIDDFGTGFNSLKYLQELELTSLKIDRSFVSNIQNPKGIILVKNIINLGHSIGVKVVAEGVENEKQYKILKELNCDFYQGFYFNKPLPSEEFIVLNNLT